MADQFIEFGAANLGIFAGCLDAQPALRLRIAAGRIVELGNLLLDVQWTL